MTNNEFNQAINRNRLEVHYAEVRVAMVPIMRAMSRAYWDGYMRNRRQKIMVRYDEITRRMITLSKADIENIEGGGEIPVEIPVGNTGRYYHIRLR